MDSGQSYNASEEDSIDSIQAQEQKRYASILGPLKTQLQLYFFNLLHLPYEKYIKASDNQFYEMLDRCFSQRKKQQVDMFFSYQIQFRTDFVENKYENNKQYRRSLRKPRNLNHLQNNKNSHHKIPQNGNQKKKQSNRQDTDSSKLSDNQIQYETKSVFYPQIGSILWMKENEQGKTEYLIKYKGRSYLHLQWLEQQQVLNLQKSAKNKLNRFRKIFQQKMEQGLLQQDILENRYFDPIYTQVDRIINTTQIFPIIHQKKANQIRNKWTQSIMLVVSKLINFSRDNIHYGIFFHQPINPQSQNYLEYKKIISNPIDLGTILNRVYLDYYKNPLDFWKDMGLVWKNCRKFNKQQDSDINVIGQALRQCSIFIYKQWHKLCFQRYIQMLKQYQKKMQDQKNQYGNSGDIDLKTLRQKIQILISTNPHIGDSSQNKVQNTQQSQNSKNAQQQSNDQKNSCKNVFLQKRKVDLPSNLNQIQKYNPGPYSYNWILQQMENQQKYLNYEYNVLDDQDFKQLNLNKQIDKLFCVKWKNLSYQQSTWQLQSQISCPQKIQDFKNFNRALDKQTRMLMINQNQRHKNLLQYENQIFTKKKSKYNPSAIFQMRNKLYYHDIQSRKQMIPYSHSKPPIYKNLKRLRDYQLQSLNWLIQAWYKKRNVILADQMGLGKTIQSIAFLNHLISIQSYRGPFLVLAPLSTLQHWKRTVEQWTNLNCILYYDPNGKNGRNKMRQNQWFYTDISTKGSVLTANQLYKFQILIVSYQVYLQDFQHILAQIPFQFIVIDQAHRLKNQNAKILNCLKKLPCKRIVLLTGTPIQNNTDQLWCLLNYIQPTHFPRLEQFKNKFGDLSTSEQVQHLHKVLKPYILRRMKEDVQQSIPPLQQTIIDIEMTTIQKTIYRALYQKNKSMLLKGFTTNTITTSLNNLQIQLRKCCNHPFLIKQMQQQMLKQCETQQQRMKKLIQASGKVTLVQKLLQKARNQKKKVLIFSQFTYMLVLLEQFLKYRGYKFQKIDGQVKAKQRQNAIDRYNDPTKNRQVFLLSTKAGGIGINLTAANVVIIFDSDWNPQNDVQATARAHRIGQQNQVIVYRLITAKTYESQMFQRSMKKLGLDQAIFMGGHFSMAQKSGRKQKGENQDRNKLSKQQTQILLKKGIIGLLDQQNPNSFFQNKIEDILSKNSRTANYSLIGGSYTLSKSSFVSDAADKQLKINDPNFWKIVLNNFQSQTQKLIKTLQTPQNFKTNDQQKVIMQQVADCVNNLIENKLSLTGYNADDQNNINKSLQIIMNQRSFSKQYRELASNWLDQINKPSRRSKKITFQQSSAPRKQIKTRSNRQILADDQIYCNSEQPQQQQNIYQIMNNKPKQVESKKDQLLRKIFCCLCQQTKCIYFCKSYCKRGFHGDCKAKMQSTTGQDIQDNEFKSDIQQFGMNQTQLKQYIDLNFICKDCNQNNVTCFICKKKGKYYGAETNRRRKDKQKPGILKFLKKKQNQKNTKQDDQDEQVIPNTQQVKKNQVVKCSTSSCPKFYHLACIQSFDGKKSFKYINSSMQNVRCGLHYCYKCYQTGDSHHLYQCIRCPRSFHNKCVNKSLIKKINKKMIVCEFHSKKKQGGKKIIKQQMLKKLSKASKEQDKLSQRRQNQDEQQSGQKQQNQIINTRSKNKQKMNKNQPVQQQQKKQQFTYQYFNLQPPESFDYQNYKSDWCRYCGSRFSSSFTSGPWGPKTLCTFHYIQWKKKKTLDLDEYIQKPVKPINISDGQELKFMISLKLKQPDIQFVLETDEPELRKKRKVQ